ncbi:hypothetical protein PV646_14240 [Streptomyces sp. ID05-26A]|nr:hypothetical protein [Streptomyces sp. ID05-26A]
MDDELVADAVRRYAEACASNDHSLCDHHESRCDQLAFELAERLRQHRLASIFDVGRELVTHQDTYPDQSWTTAALLRYVADTICVPPWWGTLSDAQRTVWLTSALARLGEKGIPPDAVVRRMLKGRLLRSITAQAIYAQAHIASISDGDPQEYMPRGVLPWVALLDSTGCPLQDGDTRETANKVSAALNGQFADEVTMWLESASIKDIVEWSLEYEPHQELRESDLAVKGGLSALSWLQDRYTETSYSDWQRSSLEWELRYAHDAEGTAYTAGVPSRVLRERPTSSKLVISAMIHRADRPHPEEEVIAGSSLNDLRDRVLNFIDEGHIAKAVNILSEAVSLYPGMNDLRCWLAFCMIMTDPREALSHLARCQPSDSVPTALIAANVSAAQVAANYTEPAIERLRLLSEDREPQEFLLWHPEELALPVSERSSGRLTSGRIGTYSIREWSSKLLAKVC